MRAQNRNHHIHRGFLIKNQHTLMIRQQLGIKQTASCTESKWEYIKQLRLRQLLGR